MVRLTGDRRLHRTQARMLAFWSPKMALLRSTNWRSRMAMTYAVSAWSMIGCVAYMQWITKKPETPAKTDEDIVQDPSLEDIPQEQKHGMSFSSTIVYKENFVPYTTRILQYFTSSNKVSNNSSTEE